MERSGDWDHTYDYVVVGSGAGGLLSGLIAADRGHRALVIEKEPAWGGSSAYSGGGMWMPNNPLMRRDGAGDSRERALTYMNAVISDVGPASSQQRREAYVDHAPRVVEYLEGKGMPFARAPRYPDYYPDAPGGMIGRGVEVLPYAGRKLGPWASTQARMANAPGIAMRSNDAQYLSLAFRTWAGFRGTMRVIWRTVTWSLLGRKPLGIGAALTGRLMRAYLDHGGEVWLESPLREIIVDEHDRVVGVEIEREGRRQRIQARVGVMLASGGFAKGAEFRRRYQPVGADWSSANPGNTGDGIAAGERIQAGIALMDDAWWGPTFMLPGGMPMFSVFDRSLPHCIMVNEQGQRFANESASYVDVGHAMLDLNKGGEPPPVWLIMDSRYMRRYIFAMAPPGMTPRSYYQSGFLKRASTIEDLARQCGIAPAGLAETTARFSEFAKRGEDPDFERGANAYDNYYGDSRNRPNPNLGAIDKAPFYACRMVPGDLGTKGGLLTDEHARVLRDDGRVLAGLYATGNTTASVMGRTYPGPGSTLGPSTTFGLIGTNHACSAFEQSSSG